ncbi:bone morphogenetic protein 10-like [Anthonomus grandis grandis]|uniref:bone morphogenetic protein 10-like n=1 Tax=Anthonomus grandis grandis TaxID=2921223 RepID=UPI0021665CC7|nr:bone morphogenetic protein 10-like [Anthonomus grandis grandis]
MHSGYLLILPVVILLWISIILIIKNSFISNTSIEVNIIDQKSFMSDKTVQKKKIKYHVPKFMLELYEQNKGTPKMDLKADLVRSLIPSQAEKYHSSEILEELTENHLLIFNLPQSEKDEVLIEAELKILSQVQFDSKLESGVKRSLKISKIDENSNLNSLQEIHVHHFNNTWISFNLTKTVQDCLNSQFKYLKLVISIDSLYHGNRFNLSILPVIDENDNHDYPLLLLSYSTTTNKTNRQKRSLEEDYEDDPNLVWNVDLKKNLKRFRKNLCKRRPLYIDFSEINYDMWIVQPSGYDAYQCQGRCFYPVAEHLNPTKHAIMQAIMHSMDPARASRSCCVPTLLDSISILYVDDKGVLTYRYAYKDMVVLECGCR